MQEPTIEPGEWEMLNHMKTIVNKVKEETSAKTYRVFNRTCVQPGPSRLVSLCGRWELQQNQECFSFKFLLSQK